ncbi:hypothetical protein Cadr_000030009 [Camelus dromedarius]|uniref:Uncharacterized protein n=1 Tax=Camelus dromedarius TaxID=9838 RepID=A0A5N4CCP4_CAMDR|nr:hypothetical protein Cadr_000030009 [Camelus dromedarius]
MKVGWWRHLGPASLFSGATLSGFLCISSRVTALCSPSRPPLSLAGCLFGRICASVTDANRGACFPASDHRAELSDDRRHLTRQAQRPQKDLTAGDAHADISLPMTTLNGTLDPDVNWIRKKTSLGPGYIRTRCACLPHILPSNLPHPHGAYQSHGFPHPLKEPLEPEKWDLEPLTLWNYNHNLAHQAPSPPQVNGRRSLGPTGPTGPPGFSSPMLEGSSHVAKRTLRPRAQSLEVWYTFRFRMALLQSRAPCRAPINPQVKMSWPRRREQRPVSTAACPHHGGQRFLVHPPELGPLSAGFRPGPGPTAAEAAQPGQQDLRTGTGDVGCQGGPGPQVLAEWGTCQVEVGDGALGPHGGHRMRMQAAQIMVSPIAGTLGSRQVELSRQRGSSHPRLFPSCPSWSSVTRPSFPCPTFPSSCGNSFHEGAFEGLVVAAPLSLGLALPLLEPLVGGWTDLGTQSRVTTAAPSPASSPPPGTCSPTWVPVLPGRVLGRRGSKEEDGHVGCSLVPGLREVALHPGGGGGCWSLALVLLAATSTTPRAVHPQGPLQRDEAEGQPGWEKALSGVDSAHLLPSHRLLPLPGLSLPDTKKMLKLGRTIPSCRFTPAESPEGCVSRRHRWPLMATNGHRRPGEACRCLLPSSAASALRTTHFNIDLAGACSSVSHLQRPQPQTSALRSFRSSRLTAPAGRSQAHCLQLDVNSITGTWHLAFQGSAGEEGGTALEWKGDSHWMSPGRKLLGGPTSQPMIPDQFSGNCSPKLALVLIRCPPPAKESFQKKPATLLEAAEN